MKTDHRTCFVTHGLAVECCDPQAAFSPQVVWHLFSSAGHQAAINQSCGQTRRQM